MPIDVRSLSDLVDPTSNCRRSLFVSSQWDWFGQFEYFNPRERERIHMLWKRTNDRNDARSYEDEHRPQKKITCIDTNNHGEGCLKIRMKIRMQSYQRSPLHSVWLNHDKIPLAYHHFDEYGREMEPKKTKESTKFLRIPPSPFPFPSHYSADPSLR